jgi:hypothetical protein
MSKSTMSKEVQKQIARDGVIAGTVSTVRATIQQILQDTRVRHIEAVYGVPKTGKPKEGKEPGTPYTVLALGQVPGKNIQTAEEVARRVVENDLIIVFSMDSKRVKEAKAEGGTSHRSLKVPTIRSIEVYTGREVPDPKKPGEFKAERKAIPVHVIQ